MASLAPKAMSMGSRHASMMPVSARERTASIMAQLARIFFACAMSPAPMLIAMSGPPPTPTSMAKEEISVTMGPHTPAPASAVSPMTGIFPMYMRSTML